MQEADATYAHQPALTSYSTGAPTGFDNNLKGRFRDPKHPEITPDQNFEKACLTSKEWTDLQLVLRTAREMKIHLLLVCQPLNAKFSQLQGTDGAVQHALLRPAAAGGRAVQGEADHVPRRGARTRIFTADCIHPSAKAWIAYDAVLNAFYHEPVTADSL